MMDGENPLAALNIALPPSLQKLYSSFDTEIAVSKAIQRGVYSGYIDEEAWIVRVFIISQMCRGCGALKQPIGHKPRRLCSGNHRWTEQQPILLFRDGAITLSEAVAKSDRNAERFLLSPQEWELKVNLYLERETYLMYRNLISDNIQEFLSIYEQLDTSSQRTLLEYAKLMRQGYDVRIIGGE